MPQNGQFIFRVYGLVQIEHQLLITHEVWNGKEMYKFPGGGVDWGEGLIDALRREFREEFNTEIASLEHVYTTDFFQPSAFNPTHQIISVYYRVQLPEATIVSSSTEHNIKPLWVPLQPELEQLLTFPIDKHVVKLLL